jgi:hypothetical protein
MDFYKVDIKCLKFFFKWEGIGMAPSKLMSLVF